MQAAAWKAPGLYRGIVLHGCHGLQWLPRLPRWAAGVHLATACNIGPAAVPRAAGVAPFMARQAGRQARGRQPGGPRIRQGATYQGSTPNPPRLTEKCFLHLLQPFCTPSVLLSPSAPSALFLHGSGLLLVSDIKNYILGGFYNVRNVQ